MSALACAWLLLAAATPPPTTTPAPSPVPTSPINILLNKSGSTGVPRGQSLAEVARHIKLKLPADQPRRLDNAAVKSLAEGVQLTTVKLAPSSGQISLPSGFDESRKEYWQRAYADSLARIPAQEKRVADLQSEAGRLQQDFYRWDDPAYRDGVIKPAWDRALAQLAEAKRELESLRKGPEVLLAAAEREGVPPGWFREPLPPARAGRAQPTVVQETPPPGTTPTPRRPPTPTPIRPGGPEGGD